MQGKDLGIVTDHTGSLIGVHYMSWWLRKKNKLNFRLDQPKFFIFFKSQEMIAPFYFASVQV